MKSQTLMTSLMLALVGSATAQTTIAADLYKWVDDKGQVHYTSSPPPATAQKPQQIDPTNPSHAAVLSSQTPASAPVVATTPAVIAGAPAATAIPNALFVLDSSGSMWAKLGDKPKIDVAKTVMADMLNKLGPEVRAGLLVYGAQRKDDCNDIEMLAPLGSSHAALVQALNSVNPKGMTPLTGAIQLAAAQLKQVEGSASVVVVSDGKETCAGDPCAAARDAANAGVNLRIHVVGFDVAPDETQQLNCIAKEGKGKYFAAKNAEQLVTALAEVQKEVVAPPTPPVVAQASTAPPPAPVSEALFEDHFDRDQLGEMWEVVKPDPNRLTLSDGKLLIAAAKSGNDFKLITPVNLTLFQKIPSGNFIALVKMTLIGTEGMRAGLYYWVDDDNFIFIGPWVRRESGNSIFYGYTSNPKVRRPTFSKMISKSKDEILFKGDKLGNRTLENESPQPEPWYLQLERSGVRFTGRISLDGAKWEEIGTHILIPKTGRIGLGAYQDWEGGNEQAVEFENFVVKGAK